MKLKKFMGIIAAVSIIASAVLSERPRRKNCLSVM